MRRLHFTRLAEQDLTEICDYIAAKSVQRAAAVVKGLEQACQMLVSQPGMGRARPELAPDLCSLTEGSHIIFYRVADDGVQVIRILHGARDLPAIFED